MELFQSWLDTVLIFGLALSNIVFVVTLKREINSLKSRNSELDKTNKASLDLTDNNLKSFDIYKKSVNINDLYEHFEWRVESETIKRVDNISEKLTKDILTKENLLEKAIEIVSKDNANIMANQFIFILYVVHNNKMNSEQIKSMVGRFFKTTPWFYDVIIKQMKELNLFIDTTHTSEPEKQIDQKKD